MARNFKVSVVIPVYNAAAYLSACVQCVCAQTLQDIEIICVDDGSTDASPEILQQHSASDSRVRVVHRENRGAGPARNAGLAAARGEYVIFLDADDLYEPQMLEHMVARAEKKHADVVICRADALVEDGRTRRMPNQLRQEHLRRCGKDAFCPRLELPQHLFQFVCGWAWDKLYRRDFLLRSGLQFQSLRHTNDAHFVYLSLVKAAVVSVEPTILVHHRLHSASTSRNTGADTTSLTTALLAIHEQIQPLGIPALEKSFHHWAMNMAVWHHLQLSGEAAAALQQDFRTRLEPALQLLAKGATYYSRKQDWVRYNEIVAPEFSNRSVAILGMTLWRREISMGRKTDYLFGIPFRCGG